MIMNCDQYTGKCVCGLEHTLETKMVVVEYNALANFEKYMDSRYPFVRIPTVHPRL